MRPSFPGQVWCRTRADVIKIDFRPSRQLALVLAIAHLGAAAAAASVDIPVGMKALVLLAIAGSLAWSLYGPVFLRSPQAIVAVELGEGRAAAFRTRRGDWHKAVIGDSTFVAPWLTILVFRVPESRLARYAVILPDSISAEDFRRLRVSLRWNMAEAR
jgi:toxin CptA